MKAQWKSSGTGYVSPQTFGSHHGRTTLQLIGDHDGHPLDVSSWLRLLKNYFWAWLAQQ